MMDAQDTAPEFSRSPAPGVTPGRMRWILLGLVWLLIAAFGLAAYSESLWLPPVDDSDELAYFNEACWIAEHGGVVRFPAHCLQGRYPYDNRHPLTAMLVSPWARPSLENVRAMRAVKALAAAGALLLAFLMARAALPLPHAAGCAALLAMSQNWYMKSRVVCAEPMIYALFFASWLLISGLVRPRGRWFWAGIAVGLAYLAKGTAMILLAAPVLALLCHGAMLLRRRRWGEISEGLAARIGKPALLFACGFILAALPLLARNVSRFGNPFYNRNSALMWAENDGMQHMTPEQRKAHPLTPLAYWKRHTLGELAGRLASGIVKQAPRLMGTLAVDASFGRPARALTLLLSAAVIGAGIWAAWRWMEGWARTFTLVLLAFTFLLFAWHSPISYASRYIATLGPVCTCAAIFGLRRLEAQKGINIMRSGAVFAALVGLVAATLLLRADWGRLTMPRGHVPTTPEYEFLLDWYQRNVTATGETCAQTPFLAPRYPIGWLLPPGTRVLDIPPFSDYETLRDYLDEHRARYLVIEGLSLRDRQEPLQQFFGTHPDGSVIVHTPPPGWRILLADPFPPADFVIFERGME